VSPGNNPTGTVEWAVAHVTQVTDAEVEQRLAAIEYAQGSVAHLAPGRTGRNLADELIADRRAEVRAEESGKPAGRRGGEH
jgi:hypothetical protein